LKGKESLWSSDVLELEGSGVTGRIENIQFIWWKVCCSMCQQERNLGNFGK